VNEIATLGIDLAKSVFQLHGVNERGNVVLRKQVRRAQLLSVMAQIRPCLVGIEACGSSQHWRRELEQFGHTVRLMSPQYVKPYVKSQKNDQSDAEAICEAVRRPNMRFVQPKSLEQQDLQSAHRVRQGLMTQRTAVINRLRGMLNEYGIVMARRPGTVRRELPEILGNSGNGLTSIARELVQELHEDFMQLEKRIRRTEALIERLGEGDDRVRRLRTIPGVGMLTATALVGAVGDARAFRNGRHMAAWLGLVPRQDSSGGKPRLLGITKRGDKYLRYLLVHGGRCITSYAQRKPTPAREWIKGICNRRGKYRAYVAQANKTARIAWAVMARGGTYRGPVMEPVAADVCL
jgi:transposase